MLSFVILGMPVPATDRAPLVMLRSLANWHKIVVLAGMLGVCLMLELSIGRPNLFSFGGATNDNFDTDHPGIVRLVRHPLLTALALWAGLPILPIGDLPHVILFGVFPGFALQGQRIIDNRKQRQGGVLAWCELKIENANSSTTGMSAYVCLSRTPVSSVFQRQRYRPGSNPHR